MVEKKGPLKLVFKLPSMEKKAAPEEVQKEIQYFGSSSPGLTDSGENMEKLQNGSDKDGVKERRLPRLRIKIRCKLNQNSQETKNNQEQRPTVENFTQETNNDQEQQPRAEKVSDEIRDDREVPKLMQNAENQDLEEMVVLDGESSKKFRLIEAEGKGNQKKRKRGFTLALSREQIEEDIAELLGPKASRKRGKKKGYRTSEHPLNHLFPCTWMESLIDY